MAPIFIICQQIGLICAFFSGLSIEFCFVLTGIVFLSEDVDQSLVSDTVAFLQD